MTIMTASPTRRDKTGHGNVPQKQYQDIYRITKRCLSVHVQTGWASTINMTSNVSPLVGNRMDFQDRVTYFLEQDWLGMAEKAAETATLI